MKGGFTREERVAMTDLKKSLEVSGLVIDKDQLMYTHVICLTSQHGKEYTQRLKVCPEVLFEISRTNLTVKSTGKKFGVAGEKSVTIEGNIKRTPQDDLEKLPTQFKQDLIRQYNWKAGGNEVTIPLQRDRSLAKVVDAINALSKQPDTDTVIEQEEDSLIEETPESTNLTAESKDKKWWNPFDQGLSIQILIHLNISFTRYHFCKCSPWGKW